MTVENIKNAIITVVQKYPIKKVDLFGSRAENRYRADSDVDLIIEFTQPVSLLMLSEIRICLEDVLGLKVDIVHGPIKDTDLLDVKKVVQLYAA